MIYASNPVHSQEPMTLNEKYEAHSVNQIIVRPISGKRKKKKNKKKKHNINDMMHIYA